MSRVCTPSSGGRFVGAVVASVLVILVACGPGYGPQEPEVSEEDVQRLEGIRSDLAGLDLIQPPEPPEELEPAHRDSLFVFRSFCETLLALCRDAINACIACDIRDPDCLPTCDVAVVTCDAAARCAEAYLKAREAAPVE